METILHKISSGIIAVVMTVTGFFSGPTSPVEISNSGNLSATNAIETPVALFSTTLANSISSSATTMTLTSATTKDGTSLASSTYSFIIDEGTASEEFVKADCTGTACTNMTRGISVVSGTTTVVALQKAHRRGASVKITDAPILLNLTRIMNGIGTIPNKISYTSHPTFLNNTELVDKQYVDAVAFGSTPVTVPAGGTGNISLPLDALLVGNGTTATKATTSPTVGYITATTTTATSTFAGAITVEGSATSTFSKGISATALNMTGSATSTFASGLQITGTGKGIIFPDGSIQTAAGQTELTATTTVFTSSGTWVKPTNVTKVEVELVGGGGGGGGAQLNSNAGGGGGGGGAYARAIISVTGNVTVTVGAAGAGGVGNNTGATGGTSSFAGTVTVSAAGGVGGVAGGFGGTGGAGGTATNADFSILGKAGTDSLLVHASRSGFGGNSIWGYGAVGVLTGTPSTGTAGTGYGAGGSGGFTSSAEATGGAGTAGVVIIKWYE